MRRTCTIATTAVAPQRRMLATVSSANPVLTGLAAEHKYTNPLWISESSLFRYTIKDIAQLKPDAHATTIMAPKRLDFFNASTLTELPKDLKKSPDVPTSVSSGKPYKGKMATDLELAATHRSYTSNYWLSRGELKKKGVSLKPDAKPLSLLMNTDEKFWNVEQFIHGEELAKVPFNGATGNVYAPGIIRDTLAAHMAANNFTYGIYFTQRQLNFFEVSPKEGAVPAEVPMNPQRLFNVTELVGGETILQDLNRAATTTPTYLLSGQPLGEIPAAAAREANAASPYWVSPRDMEIRGWKANKDAKGVVTGSGFKTLCYHLEQVDESVLPLIGRYVN